MSLFKTVFFFFYRKGRAQFFCQRLTSDGKQTIVKSTNYHFVSQYLNVLEKVMQVCKFVAQIAYNI